MQTLVADPLQRQAVLKALETNLARYEEKHGEIVIPSQPGSLADQLFGTIARR
ncbi:MAG: hypothetical protein U0521_16540 [Anaerolineae bacterium]